MNRVFDYKKVHFIGIGGISMSSLANILLYKKIQVSGSDMKRSELTDELEANGAKIFIGQKASNISEDTDLAVYTAAIKPDNPELEAARKAGIKTMTRADFLGLLMKEFEDVICISGTHGKTTTTSLISQICLDGGIDPTILNGGIMPSINSQCHIGTGKTMIAEACEYTNSFLSFFPTVGIILNVRADHLDFFKDINDVRSSFRRFAELIPGEGALIICDSIEDCGYFYEGLPCRVIRFGLDNSSDYHAENIIYDEFARGSYDLYENGSFAGRVSLCITGEHGITNSLAAIAAARLLGADMEQIIRSLGTFAGVRRRFEIKGNIGGATIIDDYAHHPDEISATLSAALRYPHEKLWVVFQPHTYSRTLSLMDDFAASLSKADAVVLTDIYAAREKNTFGVSSADLAEKIRSLGTECHYFATFDEVENFLLENCRPNEVLITMGAGDVVNIGENLLGR